MTFAAAPEYQVFPTRERPLKPFQAAVAAARETVPVGRGLRAGRAPSRTSSRPRPRSRPSSWACRWPRSSRTCTRGRRPASRPTRSAPGCRARAAGRWLWRRFDPVVARGLEQGRREYNDCRRAPRAAAAARRAHGHVARAHAGRARCRSSSTRATGRRGCASSGRCCGSRRASASRRRRATGRWCMVAPSTAQDPEHALLRAALAGLARRARAGDRHLQRPRARPAAAVPANAVLVPWLSYARSMPACDAVVMHGGHGTLVRALSCGCAAGRLPGGRRHGRERRPRGLGRAWACGCRAGCSARARCGSPWRARSATARLRARARRRRGLDAAPRWRAARRARAGGWAAGVTRPTDMEALMPYRRACSRCSAVPFLSIAGCGDDAPDAGGGAASGEQKISGAKVIDPASMDGAKGDITFCTGKDTTGSKTAGVKAFNAQPTPASRSSCSSSPSPPTSSATSSSSARRRSPPTATSSTPTSSGRRSSRSRSGSTT